MLEGQFQQWKIGTPVLVQNKNRGTIVGYGGYQREGSLRWCYLVCLEEGVDTEGKDFHIKVLCVDADNVTMRE